MMKMTSYRNDGLNLSYNYNFDNNTRLENNIRVVDSFLNYDQAGTSSDQNSTDDQEVSYSFKLIDEKNKTKNQLIFSKHILKEGLVTTRLLVKLIIMVIEIL